MVNSDLSQDHLLLYNAYNKNELLRIQIPSNFERICRTWITETKDIFLMGETETGYELWTIDLDNFSHGQKEKDNQIF